MEQYKPPEIKEISTLLELADFLGLIETSEMVNLRIKLENSKNIGQEFQKNYIKYENLANTTEALQQPEGQIGLILIKAKIAKATGNNEWYKEEINSAKTYISNLIQTNIKYEKILQKLNELTN